MTSNVAQSYPYTTETETEREAAIASATAEVRRSGHEDPGRVGTAQPGRSRMSRAARIDRGFSSVRSTSPGGCTSRATRASATLITSCATKAARPTCAEAETAVTTPDETPRPADTIRCNQCGNDVPRLEYCIRCGDPLSDEYSAEGRAEARDRFAAAPHEPLRTVALISTLFPQLPRAEMRMFRVAFLSRRGDHPRPDPARLLPGRTGQPRPCSCRC